MATEIGYTRLVVLSKIIELIEFSIFHVDLLLALDSSFFICFMERH